MFRSIDIKSTLIGGVLVTMILCVIGAVPFVPSAEYERFKIEINDNYAFILDSATGQVWSSMFPNPAETSIGVVHDPNFHAPKTFNEVD